MWMADDGLLAMLPDYLSVPFRASRSGGEVHQGKGGMIEDSLSSEHPQSARCYEIVGYRDGGEVIRSGPFTKALCEDVVAQMRGRHPGVRFETELDPEW